MSVKYPSVKMPDKRLLEKLDNLRGSKTIIVGVGSTLKGDDGAGPLLCQRLRGKIRAELMDAGTAPENFISPIVKKKPDNLIIVDALDFAASPGTFDVFEPQKLSSLAISTHILSPRLFLDIIRQSIKVNVYIIGIQPQQTGLSQPVSRPVKKAIGRLAELLISVFGPADK